VGHLTAITLPFEEWAPDNAPLTGGAVLVEGVLPATDGYAPLPLPVVQGPAGAPGNPSLLFAATTPDGLAVPLAFGRSAIARATSSSWVDVGRAGGYSAATPWDAVRWADLVLAVDGADPLQSYVIGAGAFADVPDAVANGGTTGAFVDTVFEFIVTADERQDGGATRFPSRVRWSGYQRPLLWTPSPATQSGWVDRPRIGRITGLTGGTFGLVLGEDGLDRMDYVGLPSVWQFSTLETDIGCSVPGSVVKAGDVTYWYSRRGWRASSGGPSQPIGHGKVDTWTRDQLDPDATDRMSAVALPREQCVLWSFVSHASPDGGPDQWLVYHWAEKRWTRAAVATEVLGRAATPDVFTDDDVIPGLQPITDDPLNDQLTDSFGGASVVQPAALVGGSLAVIQVTPGVVARLITKEQALIPGRRAKVTRLQPLVDGVAGGLSGYVETRDDQAMSTTRRLGPYVREVDGSLAANAAGRFHRFELQLVTPFQKAMGVVVSEVVDTGRR